MSPPRKATTLLPLSSGSWPQQKQRQPQRMQPKRRKRRRGKKTPTWMRRRPTMPRRPRATRKLMRRYQAACLCGCASVPMARIRGGSLTQRPRTRPSKPREQLVLHRRRSTKRPPSNSSRRSKWRAGRSPASLASMSSGSGTRARAARQRRSGSPIRRRASGRSRPQCALRMPWPTSRLRRASSTSWTSLAYANTQARMPSVAVVSAEEECHCARPSHLRCGMSRRALGWI
mmetsp:Transcript_8400/g.21489  ORF Transcript_8400/g.21489 Transcript_8400/m.21489 type:complete len:231 (-) Transcript_8400:994-1686(-)